jgi:hypothetical protein
MSRGGPIRDEAAMLLCPKNRADGIAVLDQLIAEMSKKISLLALCFKFALLTLIFTACVAAVWLHLTDYTSKSQILPWTLCIVSVVGIAVQFTVWYKIQHSELGRKLATLKGDIVPENLKYLISAYAADVKRAETKIGTVPSGLFASHWAILLFSSNTDMRGWVRSSDGKREQREIYTISSAVSCEPDLILEATPNSFIDARASPKRVFSRYYKNCDGSNEPANINVNPLHQWLVGGSREQYEISRERALKEEFPPVRAWKSFVMDGGRFELRSGGQRRSIKAATTEIEGELIRVFGDDLPLNKRPSTDLIRRMISSGKHNRAIWQHFDR